MKVLYPILLLLFITSFSFGQDKKEACAAKFKTGKFVYVGNGSDAVITRTKKKQIESWDKGRSKIIMKVKWIGPATYQLKVVKLVNVEGGCVKKGTIITTTITNCMSKQFMFRYKSDCGDGEAQMRKVD